MGIQGIVKLEGITAAQFGTQEQTFFKEVIAAEIGNVCGADGATKCTAADVTLTVQRRTGVSVTYKVKVHATQATASTSKLTTFVKSDKLKTNLKSKGGKLASITG